MFSFSCVCAFQGIDVLEKSLKASPSSLVVVEPFLFNLCKQFLHHYKFMFTWNHTNVLFFVKPHYMNSDPRLDLKRRRNSLLKLLNGVEMGLRHIV